MIKAFRDKGLAELFEHSRTNKIGAPMHKRVLRRLEALNVATSPVDLAVPGFNFHSLSGDRAGTYSIHVNGPWCITFEFRDGHAYGVDFEQYH